jgi:hypothetical protein
VSSRADTSSGVPSVDVPAAVNVIVVAEQVEASSRVSDRLAPRHVALREAGEKRRSNEEMKLYMAVISKRSCAGHGGLSGKATQPGSKPGNKSPSHW